MQVDIGCIDWVEEALSAEAAGLGSRRGVSGFVVESNDLGGDCSQL
jgi:hypothetical protein